MNLKKLYRPLTGMATMLALTLFTSVGSVLAAPTLTTPTMSNVGTNQITLNLTSSDTGTGYFTLLNGSGTACGTGAQVKAGQTSASTAAARFGSLPLVAATTAPYTLRNLFQTTAYTVCFTADDGTNLQATPVTANVATTTMAAIGTPAWGPVGSVGVSTGSASNTSLTFAPDGAPYVVYDELNSGILTVTVKKFTGSAWTQVGSPGINGYFPSLAFAPDGTPYLVVKSNDNGDFQVMKYNGSAWSTLGFLGYGFYSRFDSKCIAFAPDGALYMAYSDASNRDRLTVVKYNGSTWSTVGLASGFSPNIADYISLAFAPDGAPYVAYQASGSCPCGGFVMKFNGSDWIYVGGADGFTAADFPLYTSLAFASDGAPYVAYVGFTLGSVQVVKFTGSEWISVGSAGLSGDAYTSLAFAPDGAPYVAYQSYQDGGKATVIKFIGSDWTTVGSAGFSAGTATYTSLAFAPDGAPYVAYVADATYPAKATVMKLVNASTATTVTSNLNPATVGASVTFTATVTPSAATGTVTFSVDGTAWGTGTLSGGSATYSTAALTAVSHSITAAYGGDSVYLGSTSTALTQSVNKIGQTITFNNPGAQNFGTTPTLAATASSLLTPTFTSTTTGICGITSGGLLAFVTPGTCTIKADQNGNSSYNAAPTVSQSFTVNRATPSVTFGTAPTPTYLSGNFTVSASTTNTDSPSLTYSYVSGPCAFVSGAIFSSSGAGTCVVQASGALTTKFNAASQQQSVTIAKATPTATVSNTPVTYDGNAKTVAVTCLGGGASSAIAPATQTAAGTYAVTATCAGTANYNAATTLPAGNFVIDKATTTVALSNLTQTYTGSTLTPTAVTTPPGLTVDWTNAPQTNVGSTTVTATIKNANYQGSQDGTFTINKANPTINIIDPSAKVGGAATVSANGGSGVFTFSTASTTACLISGATVTGLAAGNCSIKADQVESANYNAGTQTQSFAIVKGDQIITFGPAPAVIVAGSGTVSASTTSGLVVTYASTTPATCTLGGVNNATVTGVKAGACTINAAQPGNGNFNAATAPAPQTFTITMANQIITFGAAPIIGVGSTGIVSATGGASGNPVIFSSSSLATICTVTGNTVTGVGAGTCSITANQAGADNYYNAALPITQNVIIAPVSQVSVVIQTIPSGLNFTVTDTAGTNSYTAPHVFTWVPGSSHTVTATSTQPGSTGVRYIFNNWSDSGAMTHTITAPVASATYTAAFATQYQLTTTNTDGHGSAIPVIQWYNAGYNAGVLATPNAGYVFAAWSLTSGTGPITNLATSNTSVTMNGPNTVNAAMQQLAPANLSASIVTAGKSGNVGGIRIWPITIKNTGNSSADTVALKAVTLSTSGACKPTVTTDSLLPLGYGAIAGPGSVTKNIQVNFTKCPALTKFTVTISYSGAGSITGSNTFTGVTQ